MISIDKADYVLVAQLPLHCDNRKLEIAEQHAILFDFKNIFCDFFYAIQDNWESTEAPWLVLINGGQYNNCKGVDVTIQGLRIALAYLSYARFTLGNPVTETASGAVHKEAQFSIPVPLKDLQASSTKYRDMGMALIDEARGFICSDREEAEFETYDFINCPDCGCDEHCEGEPKLSGFGLKSNTVTKKWE